MKNKFPYPYSTSDHSLKKYYLDEFNSRHYLASAALMYEYLVHYTYHVLPHPPNIALLLLLCFSFFLG